jgi:hypothetical protein
MYPNLSVQETGEKTTECGPIKRPTTDNPALTVSK